MKKTEMEPILDGYGLTTADILYHMPDYKSLLQNFVQQFYDRAPKFHKIPIFR
ncbi:MAG: hypothetical protein GY789_29675 [Hyphomicrobiales bacterium]|nr:hypothetical protein [Hyphomicrobiales bacterium]